MENEHDLMISALTGTAITFDREQLPERFRLLNWGENPTADGPLIVNERTVAALNQQIARDTFKRIVLDFEHQSVKGHPNYKEPPRHNAAHGDLAVAQGEGIDLTALSWTPTGAKHGPDYCDLSPVVVHTKRKRPGDPAIVLGIISAALCDNGAVQGISAFSASYNPPEKTMEITQEILDGLRATLEQQQTQITALQAKVDALPAGIDATAFSAVKTAAEAAVQPEALEESKKQVSALSARLDAIQKEQMIQIAVLQGKAVTLDEAAVTAMSAESLARHLSGLGATIPLVRKTPNGDPPESTTSPLSAQIDTLIASIRKETGITDFQVLWRKAKNQKPDLFKHV